MKLAAVFCILLIALCFYEAEGKRKWKCFLKKSSRYRSKYWVIENGKRTSLMKCPEGTFFSQKACNCISKQHACDKRYAGGRKFVQKTNDGSVVFTCPQGTVFDEGQCMCIYA